METNDPDFPEIQWGLLLKRLTSCAAKWFLQEGCSGDESVLPATGKSAKDLAFDAVTEFIKGGIAWTPNSDRDADFDLYLVLRKVMRHDFLDLVKEGRPYKRTDVIDPSSSENEASGERVNARVLKDLSSDTDNQFYSLNAALVARRIQPLVQGDQQLVDYVRAVLESGCLKREDIASFLKISAQDVTNLQRRLRKRLASWKQSVELAQTANQQ
jgi:hypothetical protein